MEPFIAGRRFFDKGRELRSDEARQLGLRAPGGGLTLDRVIVFCEQGFPSVAFVFHIAG